ncbi:DUF2637 domain-containing protein [Streptomyces werraensis]|uniref:DUF2637 domain-containing protein n=1 Tax=Streptomyces werraensis TaxID=68284 RepID=UPI0038136824
MKTLLKTERSKTDMAMRGIFYLILVAAMLLSGWSLTTLGMSYGMPVGFAVLTSAALDGVAIYCGYDSNRYAQTRYSGTVSKILTYGFVLASAWLNWQHAALLGYGLVGGVLFAVPSIAVGVMHSRELGWASKEAKEAQGHIVERLPVFGKLAWVLFPGKTFKGLKTVVKTRFESSVKTYESKHKTKTLDDVFEEDKTIVEDKTERVLEDKTVKTEDKKAPKTKTVEKTKVAKTRTELAKAYPDIDALDADLSINKIVLTLWGGGMKDRDELVATASRIKGTTVTKNTVNRYLSRAGLV